MKAKRVISSGDPVAHSAPQEQADKILAEIALLYRERIRALYNNDASGLRKIDTQIADLKTQLPTL